MKESKNEKNTLNVQQFLDEIVNSDDLYSPVGLQLALNHLTRSKLLIATSGEERIKNNFLNQVDQKQTKLSK